MKLVPVTPKTLSTQQMVPIRHIARYAHNNQWHEAQEVQAALINAEREVGVRAVVEVLRRLWNLTNEGTSEAELLEATRDADELLTLYQECGADLIEVPESVVHPIGPEHKLKVGDKVQSCKGGDIGVVYEPGSATKKEYPYSVAVKWQSGYQGHSTYHASFGQSVFYPGDVYYGSVTRISHAPTPEPANQTTGEWVRVHEAPTSEPDLADLPHGCVYTEAMDDYLKEHKAKLAAQKADLLEEADRVNPRLMQATDEQIEAERERRRVQALPQKLLDEAIDSLASEGIGFTRAERRVDLENLCKLARAAERELIKQEGGSHE